MHVISLLASKGGVGKTTLSIHLARQFQIEGADVLLADADIQGSSRDWAAVRPDQPLPVVGLDRPTIERDLRALSRKDYAVLDGPPRAADAVAISALKASDLVLVPVQPSALDLWAAAALVDMIRERIDLTDGRLQAAFVISRLVRGTRLGGEIADALAGYGLPVLQTRVHQRVAYAQAIASGSTVMDVDPHGDAAGEIRALATEVRAMLTRADEEPSR